MVRPQQAQAAPLAVTVREEDDAFVITAAGTGAAWTGAAVMVAFWAGTVPILLALGVGLGAVHAGLRRLAPAQKAGERSQVTTRVVPRRASSPLTKSRSFSSASGLRR